ncbi:MAG: hypothetical protein M3N12_03295, partial [Verrucomicrobiota bacterium]|nr:hypothetical protein [Verrucomicrobiota bacterium]
LESRRLRPSQSCRPGLGLPVLAMVPLVAWSRIALARYRWSEALGGMVLGALVGAVTLWA